MTSKSPGVGFVGDLEVLERVLHIAGLDAAFGHYLGVDREWLRLGPRLEHLRHPEDSAHTVGELFIVAGEDAVEERLRGGAFAAGIKEEPELGGGEEIARRGVGQNAELGFGLGLLVHAEEQVGELAAELDVAGVELEGVAEFGDERVALGKKLARHFGGAWFAAAGGGEQGGGGVFGAVERFPDAAEVDEDGAAVGQNAPCLFEVLGGERELVALLGAAWRARSAR